MKVRLNKSDGKIDDYTAENFCNEIEWNHETITFSNLMINATFKKKQNTFTFDQSSFSQSLKFKAKLIDGINV